MNTELTARDVMVEKLVQKLKQCRIVLVRIKMQNCINPLHCIGRNFCSSLVSTQIIEIPLALLFMLVRIAALVFSFPSFNLAAFFVTCEISSFQARRL